MIIIGNMKTSDGSRETSTLNVNVDMGPKVQLECAQTGTGGGTSRGQKMRPQRGTTDGPVDVTPTPKNS